jgi:hypothetical protein
MSSACKTRVTKHKRKVAIVENDLYLTAMCGVRLLLILNEGSKLRLVLGFHHFHIVSLREMHQQQAQAQIDNKRSTCVDI